MKGMSIVDIGTKNGRLAGQILVEESRVKVGASGLSDVFQLLCVSGFFAGTEVGIYPILAYLRTVAPDSDTDDLAKGANALVCPPTFRILASFPANPLRLRRSRYRRAYQARLLQSPP